MNAVEGNVRRQWVLEGLDCANCAMKIENKVKKIEGVSSCSVNFAMKMMTLETAAAYADTVSEEAKRTVTALEPHVKLKEVQTAGARKKQQAAAVNSASSEAQGQAHSHAQHEHQGHTHGHSQGRPTDTVTLMAVMKPIIMHMHRMKLMATPIVMSTGKGIHAKSCCGWAPAEF